MQKLPLLEKIGYGLGDTASNIVFQVVINFLVYFYTDVYGISAAAVGTLMLVVRMFDAVTDPVMGGIADRTETRWGKYRPYLLWMALPYGILAVLAFTTPDFDQGAKLVYAYVTYALLMTVYTAINIPYSALGGVITADTQERTSVQSWRFALAMLGGALVAAATLPMVEFFGRGNEQKGFQMAMVVMSVVAVACFIACYALTHEREEIEQEEKQGIVRDFVSLLANDQWRLIALITFLLLVSVAMRGGVTPFFVTYYLDKESLVTLFITAVPRDAWVLALAVSILANFAHMTLIPNLFSAVPDTVDYSLHRWGKGAMAMSFSGHLLALKIGIAIGGALTGWILAWVGYVPNEAQTETALNGIVFIYATGSVIAGVLILACFRFYRLTREWAEETLSAHAA
jgi:GPH family glycoside/pentoside/hexuronide:cation symporter